LLHLANIIHFLCERDFFMELDKSS